jgi:hypothetical protein
MTSSDTPSGFGRALPAGQGISKSSTAGYP